MVFDTSDDRFGDYAKRVSDQARYKQQAPQRAWDNLESLTNQAVSGNLDASGEQEFKQARRDWNRQYKNTPVGIMASGVDLDADPFGAQNLYHDMSSLMYHDQPKMFDRMYPLNPSRLISAAAENIGPFGLLNRITGKKERRVPANVLAMRKRFPGISNIDEVIPPSGIAPLVPEHIRNSTLSKLMSEDEGIFYGGRGELSPDFDYEELRMRKPFDYDLAELLEEIMAGEVETEENTKELPEDKKAELEALLLSPEFQALSQYEKEERLKEYGIYDLTPDLLEVQ
tara:strand:- start:817 stop:1671 length:855 start_codon:yes stop_codon:yes gene_type:complete